MRRWLLKTEPSTFSWDDLARDRRTDWTGVRNYQARNNLRAMRKGDLAFIYHSVEGKAVVGIARVIGEAKPDATAADGDWVSVEVAPVEALARPVPLAEVKARPGLARMALVANARLSVQPVTAAEWQAICKMGERVP